MSKNKDKKKKGKKEESIRGAVGGQAVIEGVMMKSKDSIAIAVRRESGEIVKSIKPYKSAKDKNKILNIPVVRGVVNFIEMTSMSMSTLNESIEMLGLVDEIEGKKDETTIGAPPEPEEESKMEKISKMDMKGIYEEARKDALKMKAKKSGSGSLTLIASIIGTVLGLALSFGLFFFLPTFISSLVKEAFPAIKDMGWLISIMEGVLRLTIFVGYILLVSLMKDIRRTFEYHGAEHMSVFCCEAGDELTVENAKKYSRFHPRCGTSFLIVMMIIGVIISSLIPTSFGMWPRLGVKLAVFPFIIGVGYEFIKYAGKHDNIFIKIVSAPGLWIQRLTTKKPDDQQIEVAVMSLRVALKIDPVGNVAPDVPQNSNDVPPTAANANE